MSKAFRFMIIRIVVILAIIGSSPVRFINCVFMSFSNAFYTKNDKAYDIMLWLVNRIDYPICYTNKEPNIMYSFFGLSYNVYDHKDDHTKMLFLHMRNSNKKHERVGIRKANNKLRYYFYLTLNKYKIIDN